MELANYLQNQTVLLHPKGTDKISLLKELVDSVCETAGYSEQNEVIRKVLEREKIKSTGFGKGLAVAHARMETFPKTGVGLIRPQQPVAWDALDGEPVSFILLFVGTATDDAVYLNVLSEITKLWARKEVRALLLSAQSAEEIIRIVAEAKTRTHPR